MGYKPNSTDPRPAILGKAIEVLALRPGQPVPEARRLLTSYANGATGALLTTAAEAALKR